MGCKTAAWRRECDNHRVWMFQQPAGASPLITRCWTGMPPRHVLCGDGAKPTVSQKSMGANLSFICLAWTTKKTRKVKEQKEERKDWQKKRATAEWNLFSYSTTWIDWKREEKKREKRKQNKKKVGRADGVSWDLITYSSTPPSLLPLLLLLLSKLFSFNIFNDSLLISCIWPRSQKDTRQEKGNDGEWFQNTQCGVDGAEPTPRRHHKTKPSGKNWQKKICTRLSPQNTKGVLPSISSQSSAQCHRYEKKIVKCIHVQYKEFSSGQTVKWPGAGRARQMTAMGDGRIGILALARIRTPTTKMEPRDYWFKEKEKIEMYTHSPCSFFL